ncbi:hypothetical protein ES707_02239 [subsurface metagenome]
MHKGFMLVVASILFDVIPVPHAAAVELEPGLWQLTTRIDRDGVGSTRPQYGRCVTTEQARAASTASALDINTGFKAALGSSPSQESCRLLDAKNGKDLMTWRLQCTGSISAEREFTARFDNPRHYVTVTRTSITTGSKTVTVVTTTEARHKGECPR